MHKLQELKAKGAEIISGDFTDSAVLSKAFKGCHAVFSFVPPGFDADDMEVLRDNTAEAIAQAVVKSKISHVLNLSSLGANLPSGTGPIKTLHRQEEKLNTIPHLNVLHFRPGFFMENFYWFLPGIKNSGMIATCLKTDLPLPMVATRDIASKIAEFLEELKFTGSTVFEFVGPKDITMADATKIIGKAIGKHDLKYKHLSYEEAETEMIESGIKHQMAKLTVDMDKAFNERKIKPTQEITANHRGRRLWKNFPKLFHKFINPRKKQLKDFFKSSSLRLAKPEAWKYNQIT